MKYLGAFWHYFQYLLLPLLFILILFPNIKQAFKHTWYVFVFEIKSHKRSKRQYG
jgi:hypothetical protein